MYQKLVPDKISSISFAAHQPLRNQSEHGRDAQISLQGYEEEEESVWWSEDRPQETCSCGRQCGGAGGQAREAGKSGSAGASGRHCGGAGAQASIVEHYLGTDDCDGDYLVNSVTEVYAATGARLKRYKIQQDNPATSHIATLAGQLAADAVLENFDLNLGAKLARSEIHMALQGKGADVSLSGVYLLRDKQHCDNAILMDHVVGGTNSHQDYRGILDDKAHGVFQGKITVQPDAQGIEGHQLNRTLLLSDRAEMDSKPELEIRADDVKCSHGATIGELDETGLFYLRTRGIPEAEARQLLMTAFIVETLGHIDDDAIRGVMDALVSDWMAA